jgi:hypothetical protein
MVTGEVDKTRYRRGEEGRGEGGAGGREVEESIV